MWQKKEEKAKRRARLSWACICHNVQWKLCEHLLWVLSLVVVTEKKAGERAPSMRSQFMKTSGQQIVGKKRSDKKYINTDRVQGQLSKMPLPYLGLSCPPSMYICQNFMYPSWLAVANTVPSGDNAPSLTLWRTIQAINNEKNECTESTEPKNAQKRKKYLNPWFCKFTH